MAGGSRSGGVVCHGTDRGVSYVHDGHASMAGQRSAREATGQLSTGDGTYHSTCRASNEVMVNFLGEM
jgi:hypothetical protein